jgi:uncharacterized protein
MISSPQLIPYNEWFPAIWGGEDNIPNWYSLEDMHRFMDLSQRHWNYLADTLLNYQEDFIVFFSVRGDEHNEVVSAEDWCFGYMHGVALAQWPKCHRSCKSH